LAGNIFDLLPEKSNMIVYGNMSKQKATYKQEDFHKVGKNIEGMMLFGWLSSIT
jgi:hypothetical protein